MIVLLGLALVGCGAASGTIVPSPSAAPTATGVVPATPIPGAAASRTPGISIPAPTPCPSEDPGPQPALEPISSGALKVTEMEPNFSITVPSGFSAYRLPALLILAPSATPDIQLAITQAFGDFGDLARNRYVTVSPATEVTVGGVKGEAADFEIAKERCDEVLIFRSTRAGQARSRFGAGYAKGHMIILMVGDPRTVIEYDADTPEAFAAVQKIVEPIIASIKFTT